jgi:hypothetical protein
VPWAAAHSRLFSSPSTLAMSMRTTAVRRDMAAFKDSVGVPADLGSCHTALVDNYFVEGHVPADSVHRLLAEQPMVDGIALPGMPAGTPGMPGVKDETWIGYALAGGEVREFSRY